MWRARFSHSAVVPAIAAAIATALVLGVAAAAGGDATRRCTHGLSSIGPVRIESGQIVGGDSTPHTEACLR
jgi:hypothetical protein